MPSPTSVTGPTVPRLVDKSTLAPPAMIRFPIASRACTVTSAVDIPSAGITVGVAMMVEVPGSGSPCLKSITATLARGSPFTMPETVEL